MTAPSFACPDPSARARARRMQEQRFIRATCNSPANRIAEDFRSCQLTIVAPDKGFEESARLRRARLSDSLAGELGR